MKFVAMEELAYFDEQGHFDDDSAAWVDCEAKSFKEAKDIFAEMERADSSSRVRAEVFGFYAVYEEEPFFMDELSEKLGVHIEQDTDLDALVADMAQAEAESAIDEQWIAMEQRMLRGRK